MINEISKTPTFICEEYTSFEEKNFFFLHKNIECTLSLDSPFRRIFQKQTTDYTAVTDKHICIRDGDNIRPCRIV